MVTQPARGGFTLVELLVVLVVIAILAALAAPVSSRVIQSGKASACLANLRQLGVALSAYLADHNQTMPKLQAGRHSLSENIPVIDNTLNAYAPDPRIFACPADNKGLAAGTGTSYYWNVALNGQPVSHLQFLLVTDHASQIPIMSDKEGFHPYTANKVNLLYADGHVTQDLQFATGQ